MSNSSLINLNAKIKKLKNVVKDIDSNSIMTYCFWTIYKFGTLGESVKLRSPARQCLYLMGIVSSFAEPAIMKKASDGNIKQIEILLNDIFSNYIKAYFPTKQDMKDIDENWYKVREVAMPMFTSYFFEGQKIATNEYYEIIKFYFDGFEKEIKAHFHIDHNDMLKVAELIGQQIQSNFDRLADLTLQLKTEWENFKKIDIEDFSSKMTAMQERIGDSTKEFHDLLNSGINFSFEAIQEGLNEGEVITRFKEIFTTERGASPEINYITDFNPISYRPIICNNNNYMLGSLNFLYEAILLNLENFFKNSKSAEKFRRSRDNRLEKDAKNALENFFPDTATFFESIFEKNDSQNEHDLIILNDRNIIIVEAKASPRREPLRDATKAYPRLRDDFKRKSGIQSASDQANNLRKLILKNETTPLYDKKGNLLLTIEKINYDNIYSICVTKDDFGMLATDLTLMLEKEISDPYPWVICITDLKFMLTCLADIGLDYQYLMSYIKERIEINGKATATDELDFAGAYLNYGSFEFINQNANAKVFLDINESRVFDNIHLEKINNRKYFHEIKTPDYGVLERKNLISSIIGHKFHKDKIRKKQSAQKKARRNNR